MALEKDLKLQIKPLSPSALPAVSVLFNPNAYSIVKPVTWSGAGGQSNRGLNAPTLTFGGGGCRQLTLELFFDVTEAIDGELIKDVRTRTNAIVAMTRIEKANEGRPPVCEVSWGAVAPPGSDFPFTGVITNLTQRFTLFRSSGEPVRANLTVVFLEFLDPKKDKRLTDPELTTRVVKRGDSLTRIAAEFYQDSALWRVIAHANDLDDPRRLEIGRTLDIPRLR